MPEEAGSESENLSEGGKRQARDHAPLPALVIHEIIRAEGDAELERSNVALAWSGLAAGLSMGFSFAVQALIHASLPPGGVQHLVASLGYGVGFLIVVLGRQQLFTESTLTAVLPAIADRSVKAGLNTLRLWAVVFAANIVGTWIFAAALAFGHPLPPETSASLATLAHESLAHPFWNTLLRAVFAGWLIALMVWLLPSANEARFFVILALTWVVALAKLSHIIAGSSEAAYAVLTHAAAFSDYWLKFVAPTLLGNVIGGVSLVALLNHAPVSDEAGS
jgi:formate/nitrite transporter FocA (FNT family)